MESIKLAEEAALAEAEAAVAEATAEATEGLFDFESVDEEESDDTRETDLQQNEHYQSLEDQLNHKKTNSGMHKKRKPKLRNVFRPT